MKKIDIKFIAGLVGTIAGFLLASGAFPVDSTLGVVLGGIIGGLGALGLWKAPASGKTEPTTPAV